MQNKVSSQIGRKLLVQGRVQGVFYRRFAMKKAIAAGVAGWVRNLSHGDVEIHAFGTDAQLAVYVAKLEKGPPFAKVKHISVQPIPWESHAGFQIREDANSASL
jgi:acylphosphatase